MSRLAHYGIPGEDQLGSYGLAADRASRITYTAVDVAAVGTVNHIVGAAHCQLIINTHRAADSGRPCGSVTLTSYGTTNSAVAEEPRDAPSHSLAS